MTCWSIYYWLIHVWISSWLSWFHAWLLRWDWWHIVLWNRLYHRLLNNHWLLRNHHWLLRNHHWNLLLIDHTHTSTTSSSRRLIWRHTWVILRNSTTIILLRFLSLIKWIRQAFHVKIRIESVLHFEWRSIRYISLFGKLSHPINNFTIRWNFEINSISDNWVDNLFVFISLLSELLPHKSF